MPLFLEQRHLRRPKMDAGLRISGEPPRSDGATSALRAVVLNRSRAFLL